MVAVEFESLSVIVNNRVPSEKGETFHDFFRTYTNGFSKIGYQTKVDTFKNLNNLRNNEDIVLLCGDKGSCVVILDKSIYLITLEDLIQTGINQP